ncbi:MULTISPECIES: hypothetical protein [Cyanophyceae]|uniref:hypothetical protein n=1 Tax=Cyanophyceae TaxID=3028117 RepID=UPI000810C909|nr:MULTISPECIES: hypothetical protein [Cyanophyceae]ANV87492.1 hypothetical protein AWQ22_08500 [Picosynechococcus sp. PCC 7117]
MSLIHWNKSVLSLHLREIFEDYHRGDSTALTSLGTVMLGAIALSTTFKLGKPLLKQAIKTTLTLSTNPPSSPVSLRANLESSQRHLPNTRSE